MLYPQQRPRFEVELISGKKIKGVTALTARAIKVITRSNRVSRIPRWRTSRGTILRL